MRDLVILARYPFLEESKEYIRENGPSIEELFNDPLYERARSRAVERAMGALKEKKISEGMLNSELDQNLEILSYPLARMIISFVDDDVFLRRYAHEEALRAYNLLLSEPREALLEFGAEFGVDVQKGTAESECLVYFRDYMAYAPTVHKSWKLVNRILSDGYVLVSRKELVRLFLEFLRKRFITELTALPKNPLVLKVFKDEVNHLKGVALSEKSKRDSVPVGEVDMALLPPCMKVLLASIQAGENVPHMGRFALVSFFGSLQLKSEDILKLFSSAPDFDEEKTRYQVDHISGETSDTNYVAPGCEKMRTYGLCPIDARDTWCYRSKTPLWYYKSRWRRENKVKKEKK